MTKLTRSEQIFAEKTVCILLVRGESAEGQPIYAYVGVPLNRLEEFMTAQMSRPFFPEDYGVIIESGEGEPNDDVRERMEKDYGFNHQMMVDIPDPASVGKLTRGILDTPLPDKDEA